MTPEIRRSFLTVRGQDTGWEASYVSNREIRWFAGFIYFICGLKFRVRRICHPSGSRGYWLLSPPPLLAAFLYLPDPGIKSIAQISEQIDLVLHNADHLFVSEAQEGELSILQSEITKMTVRIREQNNALKGEKKHLADSLADIAHRLRTPLTSPI